MIDGENVGKQATKMRNSFVQLGSTSRGTQKASAEHRELSFFKIPLSGSPGSKDPDVVRRERMTTKIRGSVFEIQLRFLQSCVRSMFSSSHKAVGCWHFLFSYSGYNSINHSPINFTSCAPACPNTHVNVRQQHSENLSTAHTPHNTPCPLPPRP